MYSQLQFFIGLVHSFDNDFIQSLIAWQDALSSKAMQVAEVK